MPLLLNVLRNADGIEYRKLRVKAMECAGLIGMAFFGWLMRDANRLQPLRLGRTCSGLIRIRSLSF